MTITVRRSTAGFTVETGISIIMAANSSGIEVSSVVADSVGDTPGMVALAMAAGEALPGVAEGTSAARAMAAEVTAADTGS